MSSHRGDLDVYNLTSSSLDTDSVVWWGNTLLICVETTILGLLVVTYFYVRRNFEIWPPPRVDTLPPMLRALPDLGWASADLGVLLMSVAPMIGLDRLARRRVKTEIEVEELPRRPIDPAGGFPPRTFSLPIGLLILLALLGSVALAFRFQEFRGLNVRWRDNVYGSVTWSLLGLQLSYILMSVVEVALLVIWIWQRGLTSKFAMDITLAASSWYWMVGTWVVVYLVVYWSPRWIHG